jgi:purine-binding chemotaxis protein CheW
LKAPESTLHEAEVLRRRAARLARPDGSHTAAPDMRPVLDFSIGAQRCLLELSWLREVRPLGDLMVVPGAPESLLGLVPLRGQMLPVLDLSRLLGIAAAAGSRAGRLLVLGRQAPVFGIVAGEVHGLHELAAGAAERRSEALDALRPELVRGVTREGHVYLDGERLLSLEPGASAPGALRPGSSDD